MNVSGPLYGEISTKYQESKHDLDYDPDFILNI